MVFCSAFSFAKTMVSTANPHTFGMVCCSTRSGSRKPIRKVLMCVIGLFVLISFGGSFFIIYGNFNHPPMHMEEWHPRPSTVAPEIPDGTKIILFWTKFFRADMPNLHDSLNNCPVPHCHLTTDRSLLNHSEAIVFHGNDDLYVHQDDIPTYRSPEQFYVYFNVEAPTSYESIDLSAERWRHFFNLTWTYRLDSDVLATFYLSDFYSNSEQVATGWNPEGRKNRAFTMISNCLTTGKREDYILELHKYFPVDVVGLCGEESCPKGSAGLDCEERLTRQYKFYLAFENSNCKDYITEKPFRALTFGSIPVVRGGANYSQFLPSGSFIDASSFADAAQLAAYLHTVSRDDDLYARFFQWRQHNRSVWMPAAANYSRSSVCKLCEILHEPGYRSASTGDLYGWYTNTGSSTCLPRFRGTSRWWDRAKYRFSRIVWRIRWFLNL